MNSLFRWATDLELNWQSILVKPGIFFHSFNEYSVKPVVVGHGPKGMVGHYISQSRAVSQPGREINIIIIIIIMAAFDGNVSFTSCHFNVLSVPSATYI